MRSSTALNVRGTLVQRRPERSEEGLYVCGVNHKVIIKVYKYRMVRYNTMLV